MPFVRHEDIPLQETLPGVQGRLLVHKEMGAVGVTVMEAHLPPGARIPLHIHPGHEEAIVILEGTVWAHLAGEEQELTAGHTVLAPADTVHGLENRSSTPARILAIYPTPEPKRQWVEGRP